MRRSGYPTVVLAAAVALASCGSGSHPATTTGPSPSSSVTGSAAGRAALSPTTSPAATAPAAGPRPPTVATDWPTYHHDAARSGYVASTGPVAPLRLAWRAPLDGAVYAQPLVVGNLVIVATEGDSIYGLDRSTGRVRWHTQVGRPVPLANLPCGNIDPIGITGTPAYDPATGLVFAVAETVGVDHVLVGIDVRSGDVVLRRNLPTPGGLQRDTLQRPALLVTGGRVYVGFGGLYGDCGSYRGSVVSAPTSGSGALGQYVVPTARMGAIWATGGPTLGQNGRTIYVSVGNGAATAGPYDGSDSVVALDLGLRRTDFFAPTSWAADNASDLDLGSSSVAVLPNGRLLIAGKRGVAYLLRAGALGGIGGAVTSASACRAFGGPAHVGAVVYLPCASGGLAAVDTAGDRLQVRWRGPQDADGSPVVAGDTVWVCDVGRGILYALDRTDGSVLARLDLGMTLPHFASPTPSGDLVLIGTSTGVMAVQAG